MKRVVLNIVILIIMIIIPLLPYKKEYDPSLFDENKINLHVEYDSSNENLVVIKGSGYIKRYASVNRLGNINFSEVKIVGNIPYKKISNYRIRKSEKRKFFIKGEFIKENKTPEILTLNVTEWAPLEGYVKLVETTIWHKYNLSLWVTYFGAILVFYSVYIILKNYINWSD
ncbi:MAG: hypothetical protein ACRCVJ_00410 [Clostridium sp.]|uniref:hypothetical protein n=1 Tax=Clostridium sp. TaxID=1506 RepID=UPI003F33E55C